MTPLNWANSLLACFLATVVLATLEAGAQQIRLTRMSMPYLLGTMVTANRNQAKIRGFLIHLVNGQLLGLLYVAVFHQLGHATVWLGALFGLLHGAVVLLVVIPLLPTIHPRMASAEQGPTGTRQIEPPGHFALHYGLSTPAMLLFSHLAYGAIIGAVYRVN